MSQENPLVEVKVKPLGWGTENSRAFSPEILAVRVVEMYENPLATDQDWVKCDANKGGFEAKPIIHARLLGVNTAEVPETYRAAKDFAPNIHLQPCLGGKIFCVRLSTDSTRWPAVIVFRTPFAIPPHYEAVQPRVGWEIDEYGVIKCSLQGQEMTYNPTNSRLWPWPLVYPNRFGAYGRLSRLLKDGNENTLSGLCRIPDGGYRTLAKLTKRELEIILHALEDEILAVLMNP